jgi:hypothetical protein
MELFVEYSLFPVVVEIKHDEALRSAVLPDDNLLHVSDLAVIGCCADRALFGLNDFDAK